MPKKKRPCEPQRNRHRLRLLRNAKGNLIGRGCDCGIILTASGRAVSNPKIQQGWKGLAVRPSKSHKARVKALRTKPRKQTA